MPFSSKRSASRNEYLSPPETTAATGNLRRVGIEVELAGLSVEELANVVAGELEGRVRECTAVAATVTDTVFGDFRVELDAIGLQEREYLVPLQRLGIEDPDVVHRVEDVVVAVAAEWVPVEVVSPPIRVDRLGELDPLWQAIREAGGLGTGAAVRYAFGLHLNPELPGTMDASTVLRHVQAYFLLEDWIASASKIDWTRRMVPFIDPFPEEYRRAVLHREYAPDLDTFIEDYLEYSPTRNRILDLLPLFVHLRPHCLEGKQVEGASLVKERPTFHYRLPNCEIEVDGWTPAEAWNLWVLVERLAADSVRLEAMADAYSSLRDLPWRLQRRGWVRQVEEKWL